MAIERILVATDLSRRAALAVERAIQLAAQHGAALSVLHVQDASLPDPELLQALELVEDTLRENLLQHSRRQLEQEVLHAARAAGVEPRAHVVTGQGSPQIIDLASSGRADLLVLGAHGEHYIKDHLVSTTTEKVVRHGDRPTLVVKQPASQAYQRVLVPVDFSEYSIAAAILAGRLAPEAEITLLHVLDNRTVEQLRSAGLDDKQLDRVYSEQQQRAQAEMAGLVQKLDYQPAATRLLPGYAPQVIEDFSNRQNIDLLVMGTHGRNRLQRILLGSVATHLMHESVCDILLVRVP